MEIPVFLQKVTLDFELKHTVQRFTLKYFSLSRNSICLLYYVLVWNSQQSEWDPHIVYGACLHFSLDKRQKKETQKWKGQIFSLSEHKTYLGKK